MITDRRFPTPSEPDCLPGQSGDAIAVTDCAELQGSLSRQVPAVWPSRWGLSVHEPAPTDTCRRLSIGQMQVPAAFNAQNPAAVPAV